MVEGAAPGPPRADDRGWWLGVAFSTIAVFVSLNC